MDFVQLLIENLGMILALAHQTMSNWMVMPANATGPLDPSIALTNEGSNVAYQLASAAEALSYVVAQALELLL